MFPNSDTAQNTIKFIHYMNKFKLLFLAIPILLCSFIFSENVFAEEKCLAYQYETTTESNIPGLAGSGKYATNQVCADVDSSGNVNGKPYIKNFEGNSFNDVTFDITGSGVNVKCSGNSGCKEIGLRSGDSWSNFEQTLTDMLKNNVPHLPGTSNETGYSQTTHKFLGQTNSIDDSIHTDSNGNVVNNDSYGNATDPNADAEEGEEQLPIDEACYETEIDSMGWLLCPTIKNTRDTIVPIENMIKEMLAVNTNLYSADSNTGTYVAWEVIRNLANILTIILFIVIIFSQITGYGIDNYGIKKLLPKIIITAILINLSYILCELAVDLSNILGSGLSQLFSQIAAGISAEVGTNDVSKIFTKILTALFATAGVTGLVGMEGLNITKVTGGFNGVAVMMGALALVVAVIAIVLFFVMLGARMVIIIGCIALSPIAFASNLLPNTQVFFKKWWKIFETALIIYPICGAVYGLAMIIRAIIFATNQWHFWEGIVAIVAPYLPFFFIPTMLKGAISGLGVVGGALMAMGSGVKSGFAAGANAVQNTDRFKNRVNYARKQTIPRRAEREFKRAQKIRDGKTKIPRTEGSKKYAEYRMNKAQGTMSAFEAQESKEYYDQYSGLDWGGMTQTLNTLSKNLNADPTNPEAQRRYMAAMKRADEMGMTDEMFESMDDLNLNNSTHSQLLGQLAGSKNKAISSYAKYLSKQGADTSLSFSDYVQNGGLAKSLKDDGANALVGMDDKTLKYIGEHNPNAVTDEMIMKAATNASTDGKQLNALNQLIQKRGDGGMNNYKMSSHELTNLDASTAKALVSTGNNSVMQDAWNNIQQGGEANQQILNKMSTETREFLSSQYGNGPSSNNGTGDSGTGGSDAGNNPSGSSGGGTPTSTPPALPSPTLVDPVNPYPPALPPASGDSAQSSTVNPTPTSPSSPTHPNESSHPQNPTGTISLSDTNIPHTPPSAPSSNSSNSSNPPHTPLSNPGSSSAESSAASGQDDSQLNLH